MAEHYCTEHKQVFFKKGAMKGYAHPFTDENGDKKWCNEPSTDKVIRTLADLPEPKATVEPPPKLKETPEIAPQERGMWWKELGESLRSGLIDKEKPHGAQLKLAYISEMLRVLNIKLEPKK